MDKIESIRNKLIIGTVDNADIRYKGQQFIIQAMGELKKSEITNIEYQILDPRNLNYLIEVAKKIMLRIKWKSLAHFIMKRYLND